MYIYIERERRRERPDGEHRHHLGRRSPPPLQPPSPYPLLPVKLGTQKASHGHRQDSHGQTTRQSRSHARRSRPETRQSRSHTRQSQSVMTIVARLPLFRLRVCILFHLLSVQHNQLVTKHHKPFTEHNTPVTARFWSWLEPFCRRTSLKLFKLFLLRWLTLPPLLPPDLIAASNSDEYSLSPSIQPIGTRWCFAMTT